MINDGKKFQNNHVTTPKMNKIKQTNYISLFLFIMCNLFLFCCYC